jgi:hypothetical protein
MGKLKAPSQVKVTSGKNPVEAPNSVLKEELRFRFNLIDVDGPWCLSLVGPNEHRALLKKLKDFEKMTVGEVFKGEPGKDYDFVTNPEANKRLIELIGTTEVSRLRVSDKGRIYGVRENNTFSILWWDPKHEIYPSQK